MNAALHVASRKLVLRAGGQAHGRQLFDALSFDVRAGERWAVLGPNGAGKSSLLAALAGVFPVESGTVSVQGRAISDWPAPALAEWRAWCPQFWVDPFAATVIETLGLVRRRDSWWAEASAADGDTELVGVLAELELVDLARADVRSLSGGERQRVAVATALLQGAPLLLLDEPASHLDLSHQQLLLSVLRRHAEGGGAVVASLHDLNLAWDLATHVVLIDGRGHALAGERDEVMAPHRLAEAFDVSIDQVEVCGVRRFWVGPPRTRAPR